MASPTSSPVSTASPSPSPLSTPHRKRGAELSTASRYAMAVRIAMAVPPGQGRMPAGTAASIAQEFGVCDTYPARLWSNVKDQLEAGDSLDLGSKKRSGRPTKFTPSKKKRILDFSSENPTLTLRQLAAELKALDIHVSKSQLNRWLVDAEPRTEKRRITPPLSPVDRRCASYVMSTNSITGLVGMRHQKNNTRKNVKKK